MTETENTEWIILDVLRVRCLWTLRGHLEIDQLTFNKGAKAIRGERITLSTSGAGTTSCPHAKE